MRLIVGDKNWSTWSMRPWLVLKRAGLAFEEVTVRLRQDDTADNIRTAGSPSAKAPALIDGDIVVWDSLAICEYLAEQSEGLWPEGRAARANARSAAAEMHSGFQALRNQCPMDLTLRTTLELSQDAEKDIRRIVELWTSLLARHGGPYLCGPWSIADAFFTPVATRFRTYEVDLTLYGDTGPASVYAERLLSTPDFLAWEEEALAETQKKTAY